MREKLIQKNVTLESLSDSIGLVGKSVADLAVRIDGLDVRIKDLPTHKEFGDMQNKVRELASNIQTSNTRLSISRVEQSGMARQIDEINSKIKTLATQEEMKTLGEHIEKHIDEQIDNLAISTAHEFERVHGRSDDLSISTSNKFEKVYGRFDNLDKKVDKVDTDFDNLAILVSKEIGKVRVKLEEMDKHLVNNYVSRRIYAFIDKRIHSLEKTVFGE